MVCRAWSSACLIRVRRHEPANETPAADGQPRETEAKPKKPAKGAKRANKAKATKKAKPGKEPAAERTNKKAEVIAMVKRAKGATLSEIMKATG